MTIKKVVKLKNIGRFADLSAKGDVQFKRLTLVYGQNGHGKTTLAGVLRSLATGDPAFIAERATLGAPGSPYAEILLESGQATFKDGAWSAVAADVEVFDTTFVSENVYTGEHVGPEHRKNLYQVVVGDAAVALAREIDDVDVQGRKLSASISGIEEELRAFIQAPFTLEAFIGLVPEGDLENKIKTRTTQLSSVRKDREILSRPQLERVVVPAFPVRVLAVMEASVERLAENADVRVREHLRSRMDHRGEAWIRHGLEYVGANKTCPFCDQDVSRSELVSLYSEYFSTSYREHLVEIERAANAIEQLFGERAFGTVQKRLLENDGRIQGWSEQADLREASLQVERLERPWKHLLDVVSAALKQKAANPSNPIPQDAAMQAAIRDYEDAANAVSAHNAAIDRANATIADLKKHAAATNAETLEEELRRLRNMQIRQQPNVVDLVTKLRAAREDKKALEIGKRAKKEELSRLAAEVLGKYEHSINRFLQAFGAAFAVTGTKPSFAGGKASSTYQLSINDVPLELGDSTTPRGKPCFRTALSTGDKSTLALAFFLARLQHDADIAKKCVVFDDPLSSLDCFRTACTQQEVLRIARQAKQTVVLSHDSFFLKRLFDSAHGLETKCLKTARETNSYTVKEWNILEYFLKEAHQEYFQLCSYLKDGVLEDDDLTNVARAIRPYLEGHFRHRFPDALDQNEYLGDMIGKIRVAPESSPLARMKPKLAELEDLTNYANGFHHSSTPTPRPMDAELRPYVQRALAFVQGP